MTKKKPKKSHVEITNEVRELFKRNIPDRHHDVLFGSDMSTCAFNNMWDAMRCHFGEIALIAMREYERGYEDGKNGRKKEEWK